MSHFLFAPLLITSITASSIVAGCLFSLSYVSTAAILSSPAATNAVVLSQWRTVFNHGFYLCPMPSLFAGLCCFVNAFLTWYQGSVYPEYDTKVVWALIVEGVFLISIVPFTLTFVIGVEEEILQKETRLRRSAQESKGVHGLADPRKEKESLEATKLILARWATLNYWRTCLPVIATVVGWSIW